MPRRADPIPYTHRLRLAEADPARGGKPVYLLFEPMRADDVPTVAAIEQASFPTPFTPAMFRAQLVDPDSSWWVVRRSGGDPFRTTAPPLSYIGHFRSGLGTHIAKIATDVPWRRRHLGEWTLLNMLLAAHGQGAAYASLEVRARNTAARTLYRKLGFTELQRIDGYYQDTGEDGCILAYPGLANRKAFLHLTKALAATSVDMSDRPSSS
ncbi:MAG: GNAT family N-acetyltransferase [Catenulispora sp.]|nr:GNAT family N-acetyltransferase [Catenulispora sp.]